MSNYCDGIKIKDRKGCTEQSDCTLNFVNFISYLQNYTHSNCLRVININNLLEKNYGSLISNETGKV